MGNHLESRDFIRMDYYEMGLGELAGRLLFAKGNADSQLDGKDRRLARKGKFLYMKNRKFALMAESDMRLHGRSACPGGPPQMRWLFGENPDIYTFGNYLPAGKRKLCIIYDLPEKNN